MPFGTFHKDPKSPLTIILVWAVVLVLFWAVLLTLISVPSTSGDVVENTGVQSFLLMNDQVIDEAAFINIQDQEENILPAALKKIFTFVSSNILSVNGGENTVATIGIRG